MKKILMGLLTLVLSFGFVKGNTQEIEQNFETSLTNSGGVYFEADGLKTVVNRSVLTNYNSNNGLHSAIRFDLDLGYEIINTESENNKITFKYKHDDKYKIEVTKTSETSTSKTYSVIYCNGDNITELGFPIVLHFPPTFTTEGFPIPWGEVLKATLGWAIKKALDAVFGGPQKPHSTLTSANDPTPSNNCLTAFNMCLNAGKSPTITYTSGGCSVECK
jgi:hypothetical protein